MRYGIPRNQRFDITDLHSKIAVRNLLSAFGLALDDMGYDQDQILQALELADQKYMGMLPDADLRQMLADRTGIDLIALK